jgi:hypothetical protein
MKIIPEGVFRRMISRGKVSLDKFRINSTRDEA